MLCQEFGFELLSLETIVLAQAKQRLLAGKEGPQGRNNRDEGEQTCPHEDAKENQNTPSHKQLQGFVEANLLENGLVRTV